MNFAKIIREQLKIDDTIIVPGLGAFVTEKLSAQLDEQTGTVLPPSQKVTFDSKIRNNDGVLVQLISNELNISHFEALRKIEKIREEISYSLDKDGSYSLKNLGKLIKNEKEEILFEPYEENFLSGDSYGLVEEKLLIDAEEQPEKQEPEDTEEKVTPLIPIIPETKAEQPEVVSEEKTEEKVEETVVPIPIETEKEEKEPKPVVVEEKEEKKRRFAWWWFLLILLIIIFLIWWFWFRGKDNQKVKQTEPQKKENQIPTTSADEKDSLKVDSLNIQNADKNTENQNIKIVVNDKLPPLTQPDADTYYLVSGSFKDINNVLKYYNKMEKKGLDTKYLGQYNDFYIISVGNYDSQRKAIRAQNYLLDMYPYMSFWIYNTKMLEKQSK